MFIIIIVDTKYLKKRNIEREIQQSAYGQAIVIAQSLSSQLNHAEVTSELPAVNSVIFTTVHLQQPRKRCKL